MGAFRFVLRLPDGSDAGEVSYPDSAVQAGDVIRIAGNQRVRVVSVVPRERVQEFVDGDVAALLEVEPIA